MDKKQLLRLRRLSELSVNGKSIRFKHKSGMITVAKIGSKKWAVTTRGGPACTTDSINAVLFMIDNGGGPW